MRCFHKKIKKHPSESLAKIGASPSSGHKRPANPPSYLSKDSERPTTGEKRELKGHSFCAIVATSIEYVGNDLRKKKSQFRIGVMTVFLTVSFITFLGALSQLSPIVALKSSTTSAGDFDLIMQKQV